MPRTIRCMAIRRGASAPRLLRRLLLSAAVHLLRPASVSRPSCGARISIHGACWRFKVRRRWPHVRILAGGFGLWDLRSQPGVRPGAPGWWRRLRRMAGGGPGRGRGRVGRPGATRISATAGRRRRQTWRARRSGPATRPSRRLASLSWPQRGIPNQRPTMTLYCARGDGEPDRMPASTCSPTARPAPCAPTNALAPPWLCAATAPCASKKVWPIRLRRQPAAADGALVRQRAADQSAMDACLEFPPARWYPRQP